MDHARKIFMSTLLWLPLLMCSEYVPSIQYVPSNHTVVEWIALALWIPIRVNIRLKVELYSPILFYLRGHDALLLSCVCMDLGMTSVLLWPEVCRIWFKTKWEWITESESINNLLLEKMTMKWDIHIPSYACTWRHSTYTHSLSPHPSQFTHSHKHHQPAPSGLLEDAWYTVEHSQSQVLASVKG